MSAVLSPNGIFDKVWILILHGISRENKKNLDSMTTGKMFELVIFSDVPDLLRWLLRFKNGQQTQLYS